MRTTPLGRPLAALFALLLLAPAAFAQDAPVAPAEPVAPVPPVAAVEPVPPVPPVAPEALETTRTGDDSEDVLVKGSSTRSVFAGGRTVDVEAEAPDVFAAGETVKVGGATGDNLVGAGRVVIVAGPVGGDAFVFGELLTVSADIAGDLYAAGETLIIPDGVTVGGNVYFGGAEFDLDGAIGGSLLGGGANFDIDGSIGGDVDIDAATLNVGDGASIGGTLSYSSASEGSIADGATVGKVDWTKKAPKVDSDSDDGGGSNVGWHIFLLLSGIVTGSVLLGLFPKALTQPAALLEEESPVALGVGFAVLLGVPVLAVFLALFVLPIPLSMLAMALYVPVTYLARFVAAYALGLLILRKANQVPKPMGALFAGLIVLHLVYAIPLVGPLTALVATVLGLGALFLAARRATEPQAA